MRLLSMLLFLVIGCAPKERPITDVAGPDGKPVALKLIALDTDAPVVVADSARGRVWLGRISHENGFSVVTHGQAWALEADSKIVMVWDPRARTFVSAVKQPVEAQTILAEIQKAIPGRPLHLFAAP